MSDIIVNGSIQLSTLRVLFSAYANSNPSRLDNKFNSVRVEGTANRVAITEVLSAQINSWQAAHKIDNEQAERGLAFLATGLPTNLSVRSIVTSHFATASLFSWTENGVGRKALVIAGPEIRSDGVENSLGSAIASVMFNFNQFDPTGNWEFRTDQDKDEITKAFSNELTTGAIKSVDVIGFGSVGDRFATSIGADFGGPNSKMFRDVVTFGGDQIDIFPPTVLFSAGLSDKEEVVKAVLDKLDDLFGILPGSDAGGLLRQADNVTRYSIVGSGSPFTLPGDNVVMLLNIGTSDNPFMSNGDGLFAYYRVADAKANGVTGTTLSISDTSSSVAIGGRFQIYSQTTDTSGAVIVVYGIVDSNGVRPR